MLFKNIIGQESTKKQLIKTVNDGHVGHALMFFGPEGSGNLAMATAFAGYIFCEKKTNEDRCGDCPSCKKMNVLGHPDLHYSFPIVLKKTEDICDNYYREFIDAFAADPYITLNKWEKDILGEKKKALIPASEANQIVKRLSLKSFSGGHKVIIVWMAEKLNSSAANKLLKTLEEPTDKTIVILVVNSTEEMLATVISRTQLVKCGQLTQGDIAKLLVEESDVSWELAEDVAWRAEGNLAKARQILQSDDDNSRYLDLFIAWMRACVKSNMLGALNTSEKIAALSKDEQQQFFTYCLEFMHESLMFVHAGASEARFDKDAAEFARNFAPIISKSDIAGFHEVFSRGHYLVERNAHGQLLFMHMSHEMMKIFSTPKPEAIS